jgi:hypothetical protein
MRWLERITFDALAPAPAIGVASLFVHADGARCPPTCAASSPR